MDNFECAGYLFTSNFDSGNLGRVELVRNCAETEITENIIHSEFNVWTTPDCHGTPHENPNRTWFFFSVKGGRPFRNVKINVRNLNRQAKLFSQGMQPVMRIGQYGKWERIKDKPTYSIEVDNFSISFIHHTLDKSDIEHFYAFTYPFTYTENQNMLEKFDKKYQKCVHDIKNIINRISSLEGLEKLTNTIPREINQIDINYTEMMTTPSPQNSEGYEDSTLSSESESSIYDKLSKKELLNEIYYHRELLIKSLEGRRIDLVTITSFHGIKDEREECLSNLFPDQQGYRSHLFKDKKIIFLSSRVHPGETPASFVLNGFLNLILDKKSIVGATLRQLYVFKIVPFLNPDGVFNGLYRTDTLGHNLNRMYINPKLETQPSIYAVKRLIRYYHFGCDKYDDDNHSSEMLSTSSDEPQSCSALPTINLVDNKLLIENIQNIKENVNVSKIDRSPQSSFSDQDFQDVTCCSSKESTSSEGEENIMKSVNSSANSDRLLKPRVFTEKLIPEIKAVPNEPIPKKIMSNSGQTNFCKKPLESKSRKGAFKTVFGSTHASTSRNTENKLRDHTTAQRAINKKIVQRKDYKSSSGKSPSLSSSTKVMNKKNILSNHNINVSSDFLLRSEDCVGGIEKGASEDKSNMFLYIDFHGHASKKGVFMYGNHFSNSPEAVECMLLPRLMSINCHHFHYDACNFSERNMYRKEKRDGLSKEGSGRVAVYKMTGLIKSYTLESNYNTGKYVNILPARGKETISKATNINPPKYTPTVYEEVGRALGPSILDITNSNQISRIHNSDFRTLQGLRITLRNEIERNFTQRSTISSATAKVLSSAHQNVKRTKRNPLSAPTSLPSNNDVSKENKAFYTMQWDLMQTSSTSNMVLQSNSSGSSSSNQQQQQQTIQQQQQSSSTVAPKLQLRLTRSSKKNPTKIRSSGGNGATSSSFYEKKEAPLAKKKLKSIIEASTSSTNTCTTAGGLRKDHAVCHVPPKKVKVSSSTSLAIAAGLVVVPNLPKEEASEQNKSRKILVENQHELPYKSSSSDSSLVLDTINLIETKNDDAVLDNNNTRNPDDDKEDYHILQQEDLTLSSISLTGLKTTSHAFKKDHTKNTTDITQIKECTSSESGLNSYPIKNILHNNLLPPSLSTASTDTLSTFVATESVIAANADPSLVSTTAETLATGAALPTPPTITTTIKTTQEATTPTSASLVISSSSFSNILNNNNNNNTNFSKLYFIDDDNDYDDDEDEIDDDDDDDDDNDNDEAAVPCCSRMLLHSTSLSSLSLSNSKNFLKNFRKSNKINNIDSIPHNINLSLATSTTTTISSASNNSLNSITFNNKNNNSDNNSKKLLLKKKRIVRQHDALMVKRKKNKIKSVTKH